MELIDTRFGVVVSVDDETAATLLKTGPYSILITEPTPDEKSEDVTEPENETPAEKPAVKRTQKRTVKEG